MLGFCKTGRKVTNKEKMFLMVALYREILTLPKLKGVVKIGLKLKDKTQSSEQKIQ